MNELQLILTIVILNKHLSHKRTERYVVHTSQGHFSIGQTCTVEVSFQEQLARNQIICKLTKTNDPNILLWYVGINGLSKKGALFYKNFLLNSLLDGDFHLTFWLVDLTAWGAFKNPKRLITKESSCCSKINQFHPQLKCISSSKVLKKLENLTKNSENNKLFERILCGPCIHRVSASYPPSGIKINSLFPYISYLLPNLAHVDSNKLYSAFQYLEGLLFVEEIVERKYLITRQSKFEIVFVLPNNELKYYWSIDSSFQKDMQSILTVLCSKLDISEIYVNIAFLSFKYGTNPEHRPYNAPGERLKAKNLSFEMIAGLSG